MNGHSSSFSFYITFKICKYVKAFNSYACHTKVERNFCL